jgi:hypothetical protein
MNGMAAEVNWSANLQKAQERSPEAGSVLDVIQ